MSDVLACSSCGARLAPGAPACDLCGQPVAPAESSEAEALVPVVTGGDGAGPDPQGGVYCHACGWKSPAGARFCSHCGTALQAASAPTLAPPSPGQGASAARPEGLGPRLALYVGAAFLLVGGLYLVTAASRKPGETPPSLTAQPATPGAPAQSGADTAFAPLSPDAERQVQALEAEAAGLSGAARTAKHLELTNLLIGLGRPDRAAEVAEASARDVDTPEAWKRAGDLLYRWMEALPEAQRGTVAPRVVAAYDRVLAARADDLDARTNLGWAAQYDAGGNPMRAITETNEVLRRDSLHLGATYNRGWFLRAIGRLDQAIAQFEKVRRLAGPETPLGREAQLMIDGVRQQQNGAATGSGAPSGPAAPQQP